MEKRAAPVGCSVSRPLFGFTVSALVRASAPRSLLFVVLAMSGPSSAAGCLDAQSQAKPADPQRRNPAPVTTEGTAAATVEVDPGAARADTIQRLKEFGPLPAGDITSLAGPATASSAPAPNTATSEGAGHLGASTSSASRLTPVEPIQVILQDRLRYLHEYDATMAALQAATNPEAPPDQQVADARAKIEELQGKLKQAAISPDTLLPAIFRDRALKISTELGSQMKDAIEVASIELKDWKTKLESLQAEIARWNSLMNARRADRDNLFEQVTRLTAKHEEFRSAVTDAPTAAERRIAHERLVNFEWRLRVESLRLRVIEAQLAQETKQSEARERQVEVCRLHVQLAVKTLEPMQMRYHIVADAQERDLARARIDEENKARASDDPLERFRAWRTAELIALESQVLRNEQDLVISPAPSYEEQRTLADHADFDFANIKELLDDGKVSRLDAIRLNNEFRRIGPERDRLVKNEMAAIEAQLQFYENALTTVELELLQDSLHDRLEHDLLRERLPSTRWAQGESMVTDFERRHRSLLVRRQRALEKLCERASHTLVQVTRRLTILDREYGFIRTNIFWVRDQEPIGLLTLGQSGREFNVLVKGLVRMAKEIVNRNLWGQPSGEFLATFLAVLLFPIGLVRLRRTLRIWVKENLPG